MELDILFNQIKLSKWPSDEELVAYLLEKRGYGGDDGYYGVTYAEDMDEGELLPDGYLCVNFYDGEFKELQISEAVYIEKLRVYLLSANRRDLLEKIENV